MQHDDRRTPGDLVRRAPGNPILDVRDFRDAGHPLGDDLSAVFNPGATLLPDGRTLLLCRAEDRTGHSRFVVATSQDGVGDWSVHGDAGLAPDPRNHPEECWGIEDPRITYIHELGKYAVVYAAYGEHGPGVSIALTADFREFERLGMVLPPEDKDAALLPRRIGGDWIMIHRPVPNPDAKHVWMSRSPDLVHWGRRELVLRAARGGWWDARKTGLSTPLIETPRGWLLVYHGVRETVGGSIYRVGLALLDLENPAVCIKRSNRWLIGPETEGERTGDVPNVVFPCGCTVNSAGTVRLYYGMADTAIGMAEGDLDQWLDWLDRNGRREPEQQAW